MAVTALRSIVPPTRVLSPANSSRCYTQASVASAISFSIGAAIPLLSAAFIKDPMIRWAFQPAAHVRCASGTAVLLSHP